MSPKKRAPKHQQVLSFIHLIAAFFIYNISKKQEWFPYTSYPYITSNAELLVVIFRWVVDWPPTKQLQKLLSVNELTFLVGGGLNLVILFDIATFFKTEVKRQPIVRACFFCDSCYDNRYSTL